MKEKHYKNIRSVVIFFVLIMISFSVFRGNMLLGIISGLTSFVFLSFVKHQAKIKKDEREVFVQDKSSRMSYSIITSLCGILSFILLLLSKGGISVFRNGEWLFIETLGMMFAYLTLFLILIYALIHRYFDLEMGGGKDEK